MTQRNDENVTSDICHPIWLLIPHHRMRTVAVNSALEDNRSWGWYNV